MPRFRFRIVNGTGITEDEVGQVLADMREARATAIASVRSILAGEILEGQLDLTGVIEVTSDHGPDQFTLKFREAVEVIVGPDDLASFARQSAKR